MNLRTEFTMTMGVIGFWMGKTYTHACLVQKNRLSIPSFSCQGALIELVLARRS